MALGGDAFTEVVQQRGDHVLLAFTRPVGARGRLQSVLVPADLVAARRAPDRLEEGEDVVRNIYLTFLVPEELVWIVKHHGLFQMYYYAHHFGDDRNVRDQYRDHPYYDACVRFCELYDQCSFDPDYATEPAEFFTPMVRRVFGGVEPPT